MAIRYFTATTGNWSTVSNWDNWQTSGAPGIGGNAGVTDDVYTNGKTVIVDTNIDIGNGVLRNASLASPSITLGGICTTSTNSNITFRGNAVGYSGSGINILLRNTGSTTLNFFGYASGGTTAGSYCIDNYGTLNFSGLCYGNTVQVIYNRPTGVISASSISITGSSGGAVYAIEDTSTATTSTIMYVNSVSIPLCYIKSSIGTGWIYGNFLANGTSSSFFFPYFTNTGGGTLNISGNTGFTGATATGPLSGSVTANRLVTNTSSGTTNVYGDIYVQSQGTHRSSSTATGGFVHNSSTTGIINVYGNLYGSNNATIANLGICCVFNELAGTINISGNTFSGGTSNSASYTVDGGGAGLNSLITNFATGTINVTGNTIGSGDGNYSIPIINNAAGVINVTANTLNMGTGINSHIAFNVSIGRITINTPLNGTNTRSTNTYNPSTVVGFGAFLYNAGGTPGTINFVGNNILSSFGSNSAIVNNSSGFINITGNTIIGGTGNTATINNNGIGTINISGVTLISGGSGSTAAFLVSNGNTGSINITGSSGVNLYNAIGTSTSYMINNLGGTPGTINISSANTLSSILSSAAVVWNNSNGNINITGSSFIAGTGNIGTITNVTTGNVNLSGVNLISGGTGGSTTSYLLNNGGAGSISVTGSNVTMYGSVGTVNHTVYNASAGGRITISTATTIVTTASTGAAHAIYNSGTTTTTISGTVLNFVLNPSQNAVYNNSTGSINITGTTFNNQNQATSYTFFNNSTGTIGITANNILNSNLYGNHTVFNNSTGTINISATTLSASNLFNTYTVYSTTAGILNITADTISSSNVSPAIYSTASASRTNVTFGNLVFNNGISPIYNTATIPSTMVTNTSQDSIIVMEDINNNYVEFATSGFTGNNSAILPSSGNVRSNLVYGYSAATTSLTGSSIIPPSTAVTYGTIYDATTSGSAVISVVQFGQSLTTSGQTV